MEKLHENQNEEYKQDQNMENLIEDEAFAQKEAIASAKLGRSLVKKTVKIVESGENYQQLKSFRLRHGYADASSATLELNAELKKQNIPIKANVVNDWHDNNNGGWYDTHLEIEEVEGKIDPQIHKLRQMRIENSK